MVEREEALRAMVNTFAYASFEEVIAKDPDLASRPNILENPFFDRVVTLLTDLTLAHDQSEELDLDQVDQRNTLTLLKYLFLAACEIVLLEHITGYQFRVDGAFWLNATVELSAEEARRLQALLDRVGLKTNQGPTGPIPEDFLS